MFFEKLSTQAMVAGVSYAILVILYLFNIKNKKMWPIIIIFGLVLSLLMTYDINCLTAGNCETWSWIRVSVILLTTIIMFYQTFSTRV